MDRDKDDGFEGMYVTLPAPIHQINPKPPAGKNTTYGALFEHDEHFFDGMLSAEGIQQNSCVSQLASSISKPANMSIDIVSPSTANTFPVKRAMPPQFWNEPAGSLASSSGKRFHGDLNSGNTATDDNNSFVSLLNQLPQSVQFNPNSATLLGSLGDGSLRQQYHLPSMNWNS